MQEGGTGVIGVTPARGDSVQRYSRALLVWFGGAAAFLLGGFVTAAHELSAEDFPPGGLTAHVRAVDRNVAYNHADPDFGLSREIAGLSQNQAGFRQCLSRRRRWCA